MIEGGAPVVTPDVDIEPAGERVTSFTEVVHALTAAQARCEAGRCLRCDLESRQLCPTGRALFEAAQEKCEQLVNPEPVETKARA